MDSVKFHFPLQFYNRFIHQFWKNSNTGISWLSTSSAEPAFSKPCPCLSPSDHRCGEEEERGKQTWGGRRPAGHTRHGGHPTEEPILSQGSYGNLQCLKISPNMLTSKHTCKIQRTRLCQGLTEAYPNWRPNPRHAGSLPPSRLEMGRPVMCNLVFFHSQNLFSPSERCVDLSTDSSRFSQLLFTDETTSLAPRCLQTRAENQSDTPFSSLSFANTWSSVLQY